MDDRAPIAYCFNVINLGMYMNKELAARFVTNILTLTTVFFSIGLISSNIQLNIQNIFPYLTSSIVGTGVGIVYFQFIGFKFTKFQFISCIVPTVLFSFIVMKSGLHHNWLVHDLTAIISFMLVVLDSLESKRKLF